MTTLLRSQKNPGEAGKPCVLSPIATQYANLTNIRRISPHEIDQIRSNMAWNAAIPQLLAVGTTIDSSKGETTLTMDFVDMKDSFRLSRIRQPRATLAAILLLAAVFIAFGVFADQALPSVGASNYVGADVDFIPAWLHIQNIFDLWKP